MLNLIAALPEVKGHLELPYQVLDHLYRHLDPFEQAVYSQLYRLSWGHKKNRCLISNERLAERANMSLSKVKTTTTALESKGLIQKLERPHGLKVVQGVEYEVFAPSWQAQRSRLPESQPHESQPPHDPNKDKALKENLKGRDASQCPDCWGTSFWYPEGTAKGVARCEHRRL
jgi:hypothetical protein